jgi:hypothetical protein
MDVSRNDIGSTTRREMHILAGQLTSFMSCSSGAPPFERGPSFLSQNSVEPRRGVTCARH